MKPVTHFVSEGHGGMSRYVARLVAAQIAMRRRRVEVFGPPTLQLPPGVPVRPYAPIHQPRGLNHWKFLLATAIVGTGRGSSGELHHTHSLVTTASDVHTFHGFYTRDWLTKAGLDRSTAWYAASRLQFELLRRVERSLLRRARTVVFVSSDDREYAERHLDAEKARAGHVIFPGVDGDRYSPELRRHKYDERRQRFPDVSPDARWLLFVGYDFSGKGLFRILTELTRVERTAGDGYELLTFGGSSLEQGRARELARGAGIRAHVFLDDSRLLEAFGLSDVLVMDSVSEGFPQVLLEAMASGCVPVVTRFGGVRDAIQDGVNGIVGETAADLVHVALTADEATLLAMSERAHRAACRRSWRVVADDYEAVYGAL
jgi:glycosyltransferase involved in cell wall biosynthesis